MSFGTAGQPVCPPARVVHVLRCVVAFQQSPPTEADSKGSTPAEKPKETTTTKADTPAPDAISDERDGDTAAEPPRKFVWRQHPSFRYRKILRIDFRAKLQEDIRASYDGASTTAGLRTYELHRSRIGIQGNLFQHIDFEVERELTEKELTEDLAAGIGRQSLWKDVSVNLDYINNAQIQVGKFKVPFGLDQLTGATDNDFVYRSIGASYLAPGRDIGVTVHGRFFKRGLNYWTGMFRHDGDNARSRKIQGGDQTIALRLTGTPLRPLAWRGFETLAVGTALTTSTLSDDSFLPNGLRARTVMTRDTFFSPVYVKGRRQRWEADLDWTGGPASLRAEYTRVTDNRHGQGYNDQDLPDARYRSWYVSAAWLLTGENKTRPVTPDRDFLAGGIGAVEIAARYERLWCDSVGGTDDLFSNPRAENILPSGDRALTLGVNWTLNRFIVLQLNVIREQVEDPQRSPVPKGAAFWSRVVRIQFVL